MVVKLKMCNAVVQFVACFDGEIMEDVLQGGNTVPSFLCMLHSQISILFEFVFDVQINVHFY
uniref:Uncharacterized protein n=1 Tax=Anguilla anguilla TaxID=7936 RepID=A0A0E9XCU4_ANGAN